MFIPGPFNALRAMVPRSRWPTALAAVAAMALVAAGCTAGAVAPDPEAVTVLGTVTEIVDDTPVDGGVTVTLDVVGGGEERLLFGSLFTVPPPGPDRLALYERLAQARVGSRVRAEGRRVDGGIELTDFRILIP